MIPRAIPSPTSGTLDVGPLQVTAYGLMIALGVIAAVWLASRRLERSGAGTRDDMQAIALWSVLGGLVGARLYHVATDWQRFDNDLATVPMVWRGGLGIPGGLLGGVIAGVIATRRRRISVPAVLTAAAPAIPLAQAIGRWGNWWNQELFGRPTGLPWGLEIDADHLPNGFAEGTLFHPTFLYESLWSLGLCAALLLIDRVTDLRPGRLFVVYLVGYFFGRFMIEGLRIDPAHSALGWRLNQWVALAVVVAGLGFLVADWWRHRSESVPTEPDANSSAPDAQSSVRPTA